MWWFVGQALPTARTLSCGVGLTVADFVFVDANTLHLTLEGECRGCAGRATDVTVTNPGPLSAALTAGLGHALILPGGAAVRANTGGAAVGYQRGFWRMIRAGMPFPSCT